MSPGLPSLPSNGIPGVDFRVKVFGSDPGKQVIQAITRILNHTDNKLTVLQGKIDR